MHANFPQKAHTSDPGIEPRTLLPHQNKGSETNSLAIPRWICALCAAVWLKGELPFRYLLCNKREAEPQVSLTSAKSHKDKVYNVKAGRG